MIGGPMTDIPKQLRFQRGMFARVESNHRVVPTDAYGAEIEYQEDWLAGWDWMNTRINNALHEFDGLLGYDAFDDHAGFNGCVGRDGHADRRPDPR